MKQWSERLTSTMKKGFRWEIQKLIVLDKPLPRFEDGRLDLNEIENIMLQEK